MTLFRAQTIDTPDDPFSGGVLRADADAGLLVEDGVIVERGAFADLRSRHPDADLVELPDGVLLPGLVDSHVHFPQVRVIGALGMPLLEWLERCALPEEARLAEAGYARAVAGEFVDGLVGAGTTTALVFGSHFAPAVDALFTVAAARGLRITSGLVVSDRMLRADLHTSARRGYDEGRALAERWHGTGRSRYAVTPRFALSCSDDLLASCAQLHGELADGWFTSHLNENLDEIATVGRLFGGGSYLDCYDRHDLVGRRSVLAHDVHPTDVELKRLAEAGASVAHCPTSNSALGSGLFPLNRHLAYGVHVALGTDVGAGTGFSLFKEGLQAYLLQRLRGADGVALTAAHLLHLATAAGARALGLRDQVGDLSVGRRFDAIWVRPRPGTPLDIGMRHAGGPEEALARVFALGTPHDVAQVWIDGVPVGSSG
ncbi:guanine deaminase [Amorphoplanes digitatis]|uniref:Guanine deaminase n=1 Tax=Actinoplanes digitatis TaxID=1868 RepID=A0A7W7I0P9_9ACTN|nr:guanine deaminase [Actinoplanes digitatis]MBB4764275.1 guanine deaminase [Actinoplanes digitatis]GID96333.1 putative guanine deaminase [Actinoplanes digitatis]